MCNWQLSRWDFQVSCSTHLITSSFTPLPPPLPPSLFPLPPSLPTYLPTSLPPPSLPPSIPIYLLISPLEHILDKSLQSFKASLTCTAYISKQPNLQKLLGDVIAGSAHIDELFPYYLKHTREKYPAVTLIPQLREISNLSEPHLWCVCVHV